MSVALVFIHPASDHCSGRSLRQGAATAGARLVSAAADARADVDLITKTVAAARIADAARRESNNGGLGRWLSGGLSAVADHLDVGLGSHVGTNLGTQLGDMADEWYESAQHRLRRAAGFVWDLPGEVVDLVGDAAFTIADWGDDIVLDELLSRLRAVRLILTLTVDVSLTPRAAPLVRSTWNRYIAPYLADRLIDTFESPSAQNHNGSPGTGGDLGGTFSDRSVHTPPSRSRSRKEQSLAEQGRDAVVSGLAHTADSHRIQPDEFEIIDHGDNRYTLVLAGVTDLSNPGRGLNPNHRSVRDTDVAATRSAASVRIDDNLYAQYVMRYTTANLPEGSSIAIVGHSFGADTAIDLAADPTFNGEHFEVTHVTAAGYYSIPQLDHVPNGTNVLVLRNNKDIPVLVEELGHASAPAELLGFGRGDALVREFNGGWEGAGHHQNNYIEYLSETDDHHVVGFLTDWADSGYAVDGPSTAVDISVPADGVHP